MATLKPTTPLLTPNKGPLKPASPLHPKNAPKTPISHPQRRRWFQLAHLTGPQRRRWFQTTRPPGRRSQAAVPVGGDRAWPNNKPTHRATSATWHHWCGGHRRVRRAWLQCSWAAEGPGWASSRRTSTRQHTRPHWCGGRRRVQRARLRHPRAVAGPGRAIHSDLAPLVWRAPEGPEGTGGLRGAAPNEVRPPSLAGGRALRRPEHQRGNKHQHAARTASGRAAAHRHSKRPGPQVRQA